VLPGYRLYAQAEGKSPKTISTVSAAVIYLDNFLKSQNLSCLISSIGPSEIRAFIVNLQKRRPFESHPFARAQQRNLSPHSINSYLRSIRAFWSWLISEELLYVNPFSKVKIPKAPRKVVVTLSPSQIKALLDQIANSTTTGLRDTLAIIIMLDSALRVSEATSLRLANVSLEESTFRIMGKGGWFAGWVQQR